MIGIILRNETDAAIPFMTDSLERREVVDFTDSIYRERCYEQK